MISLRRSTSAGVPRASRSALYSGISKSDSSSSVMKLSGTYVRAGVSNATGQIRFSFPASTGRFGIRFEPY